MGNQAYEDLYNDETLQTYQTVQLLIKNGWTAKDFKDNGIDVTILKLPTTTPASLTRYYLNESGSQYGGNIYETYSGEVGISLAFTAAELKEAGYTDAEIKEAASDTTPLKFYTNKTTNVASTKKCVFCFNL